MFYLKVTFSGNDPLHARIYSVAEASFEKLRCPYCDKDVFRDKIDLKRHVDSVHLKLKPFPCRFCGRSFALNYTRKTHENRSCYRNIKPSSFHGGLWCLARILVLLGLFPNVSLFNSLRYLKYVFLSIYYIII